MRATRRALLKVGAGALSASAVAGCLDDLDLESADGGEGVQASFYLLYDLAGNVAGDVTAVESIVPFGQHGHGWQPTGQVQSDIYDAAAFVYMGQGFQPWADDTVENLRSDDAGVEIIEAWEGIDLLEMSGDGHDDDNEHEDHDHEDHDHEDHDHDDHDTMRADPHFWLDPLRTQEAVGNIRDGLIEAFPDEEDRLRDQADEYAEELDELHQQFESQLEGASQDHVLVAGHNAFRYLSARYGFEVHALADISPDEDPSPQDRQRAQSLIEEHGIEYILAPELEPKRAANQLVEETGAQEVLPISAISGVTDGWQDEGWGYVEIMENVNLPSLAKALHAE